MATAVCSKLGVSFRFSNSVRSFICSYFYRTDVSRRNSHHTQVFIYDLFDFVEKIVVEMNRVRSSHLTEFMFTADSCQNRKHNVHVSDQDSCF